MVLTAVAQDGKALEFASPRLRASRPVVLTAVRSTGAALAHAESNVAGDPEVVVAACAPNVARHPVGRGCGIIGSRDDLQSGAATADPLPSCFSPPPRLLAASSIHALQFAPRRWRSAAALRTHIIAAMEQRAAFECFFKGAEDAAARKAVATVEVVPQKAACYNAHKTGSNGNKDTEDAHGSANENDEVELIVAQVITDALSEVAERVSDNSKLFVYAVTASDGKTRSPPSPPSSPRSPTGSTVPPVGAKLRENEEALFDRKDTRGTTAAEGSASVSGHAEPIVARQVQSAHVARLGCLDGDTLHALRVEVAEFAGVPTGAYLRDLRALKRRGV